MELGADPTRDAGTGSALHAVHTQCLESKASFAIRELITLPLWKEGPVVGKKVVFVGIEGAASCLNGKIGTVLKL